MKGLKLNKLTTKEIENIKDVWGPKSFSHPTSFFYEGQIPPVGLLLLEGELSLYKRKKLIRTVPPGTLLGVFELLSLAPVKVSAHIASPTVVSIIDRFTLLDLLNNQVESIQKTLPFLHEVLEKENF